MSNVTTATVNPASVEAVKKMSERVDYPLRFRRLNHGSDKAPVAEILLAMPDGLLAGTNLILAQVFDGAKGQRIASVGNAWTSAVEPDYTVGADGDSWAFNPRAKRAVELAVNKKTAFSNRLASEMLSAYLAFKATGKENQIVSI